MLPSHALRSVRRIEPEILDHTPLEEARRSLGDLVRINRLLGGHEVLRKTLAKVVDESSTFTMLDVGAASGDMGRAVRERYPGALVTSLDYRADHLIEAADPRVAADAFHLPFRPKSFDIVHCSLFLHHFRFRQVVELLRAFGELARRHLVVTDLERHWLPRLALPATRWIFHWDPITLHDGPISVSAGFRPSELRHIAEVAGLRDIEVRRHRPAFRLALIARPRGRTVIYP